MANDTENINYIVNKYSDMIYRLAYQYTFDKSEAEDIMQDTFMAMLKKMPFRDEDHLKAWLIRVAINKSKDVLKSSRRKVLSLDERIASSATYENGEPFEALEQLPAFDRTVIYLFYYEGYSTKEIADMTGKTRNAINIRLSRVRETLKSMLEEG